MGHYIPCNDDEALMRTEGTDSANADWKETMKDQLQKKITELRARADALILDVNEGHAPLYEADYARACRSIADEIEALLRAEGDASPRRAGDETGGES